MRLETGPAQMPEDWPGVFIRGDQALHFAVTLRHYLAEGHLPKGLMTDEQRRNHATTRALDRAVLAGLADTLERCRAGECEPQLIDWASGEMNGGADAGA